MGGGRAGSQPSLTITGGPGKGGGRAGSQPSLTITGGAGKGGGRAGSQPTIQAATSVDVPARTFKLKGSVNYGGSSWSRKSDITSNAEKNRAGSSVNSSSGEQNPRVADPEGNYFFTLIIGDVEVAQFRECSGLKSHTQVFELEEGGVNHVVHKFPGQSRWDNIVLKAGVTKNTDLMEWRNEILQDEFGKRRNGCIVMMAWADSNLTGEVRRYNFVEAWPVSWEGPAFDASGAEIAIESLEIAHHGLYVT